MNLNKIHELLRVMYSKTIFKKYPLIFKNKDSSLHKQA